jgi:hypothetical protein
MTVLRNLPYVWDGEAMIPDAKFKKLAERQFIKGERYVLEAHDQVSHKERAHYHATIAEAHSNLEGDVLERYPTPEHLRKWALVKAGWRTVQHQSFDTEARANWVATMIRSKDAFAVVTVQGKLVTVYTPRSQRVGPGCMTREEWQQSKRDVLDIVSGTIGVSRKALEKEGRLNAP